MAVHCRKGLHYHQIPLLPWIPKLYLRHESHIAKPHGFYSKCAVDDGARKFLEMSPVTFFVLSFNGLPIKELKQFLGQYLPCDYLCKKDNGDRKNSGTLRGAGIFQGSSLESSRVLDLFLTRNLIFGTERFHIGSGGSCGAIAQALT